MSQVNVVELPQPVNILLVEDDEVDAEAVARILRRQKIGNPFFLARDGVEALYLLRKTEHVNIPCLVLLDINMPRMNGFQLLTEMRKEPPMSQNVVYMLTTSDRAEDRKSAESLQAAGYILKENLPEIADILRAYCPPAA